MSISTKRGDAGQTGLAGGIRVSKSCARVEAYGTIDELNASLGLARSICEDANLKTATAAIQRELFRVGSALATPAESPKPQVPVTREMVTPSPIKSIRSINRRRALRLVCLWRAHRGRSL